MMSVRFLLLFLIGLAAGCQPGILRDGPPADPCFGGDYSDGRISLPMRYNAGLVTAAVIKEPSADDPWEGMGFVGRIAGTGRAEGVLTLNFADSSVQELTNYGIRLEPLTGDCDTRNRLVFTSREYRFQDRDYSLSYTLTRQP